MKLATPKLSNPKPAKSTGRSCWYRFYAMFSEQFAEEVLASANLHRDAVVLDPWLGVGTTTAVSARMGLRSVGNDINPVMIAVANGRSIDQESASESIDAVAKITRRTKSPGAPVDDPLLEWFGPSAASGLRECQRFFQSTFPADKFPLKSGFLHTALFEAAWKLAKSYRSKNPTWIKKPLEADRADCSSQNIAKLMLSTAKKKVADCEAKMATMPTLQLGTSTRLDLPSSSVDFVLTSPPYCTRIDYAVSTRIELAILGYGDDDVSGLRNAMMGTSTIRRMEKGPQESWGPTCNSLLNQVLTHPSKSSANYYYKTFIQYFTDLNSSLVEINRCAKPKAGIVIVIQDSHYKGIHIDLPRIVEEMGRELRWKLKSRADYCVSQTMLRVNTRSRNYRSDSSAVESVLWFNTSSKA